MSETILFSEFDKFFDSVGVGKPVEKAIVEEKKGYELHDATYVSQVTTYDREQRELEFEKRVASCGLKMDELIPILRSSGNTQIQSCAGSGKTTVLILKLIRDMYIGDCMQNVEVRTAEGVKTCAVTAPILVTTFLKSGALELEKAFYGWIKRLKLTNIDTKKVTFATLDAEAYRAYEATQGVKIDLITESDNRNILRKALTQLRFRQGKAITQEYLLDMSTLVGYVRSRLDDKRYVHKLIKTYDLNRVAIANLILKCQEAREYGGKKDFDDIKEILLDSLRHNPETRRQVQGRYKYLYCDEMQDTSQVQYALLQFYFDSCERSVIIGDDDQTIYTWRGSDVNVLTHYYKEDYKPSTYCLSLNYRCAKNILNCVVPSITRNRNRTRKPIAGVREGGEVKVMQGYSIAELLKGVEEDVANGKRVAILSRLNEDLMIPALMLEMSGEVVFQTTSTLKMTSGLPKKIFGAVKLIRGKFDESFKDYFEMFLPFAYKAEAENLVSALMTDTKKTIYTLDAEDLKHSVPVLYDCLLKPLRDMKDRYSAVECYVALLHLMRLTFKDNSSYCTRARMLIDYVMDLVRTDMFKDKSAVELNMLFETGLPRRLAMHVDVKNPQVRLTTIHDAKGKEWDAVYLWNLTEDDHDMTAEEYEEERRLFYIAWTRARDKLVYFCSTQKPSPFLKECDLTGENVQIQNIKEEIQMQDVMCLKARRSS